MANPTTNFGWVMPTSTDLVTDLPADFAVFGQGVDTTMADLKGGTTGQILSKASNTDMDFTWISSSGDIEGVTAGTGISGGGTSGTVTITNSMATAIDAKGDLIVGTGADAFSRLAVGSNNYVLTADSAEATGMKWATVAGGLTLVTSGSFSGVSNITIDNCFTTTYRRYMVLLSEFYAATAADDTLLQLRYSSSTKTSSYYGGAQSVDRTGTQTLYGTNNASAYTIGQNSGSNIATASSYTIWFDLVGQTTASAKFYGQGFNNGGNQVSVTFAGMQDDQNNYTGLVFSSSSSNITGRYAVYGLAN